MGGVVAIPAGGSLPFNPRREPKANRRPVRLALWSLVIAAIAIAAAAMAAASLPPRRLAATPPPAKFRGRDVLV